MVNLKQNKCLKNNKVRLPNSFSITKKHSTNKKKLLKSLSISKNHSTNKQKLPKLKTKASNFYVSDTVQDYCKNEKMYRKEHKPNAKGWCIVELKSESVNQTVKQNNNNIVEVSCSETVLNPIPVMGLVIPKTATIDSTNMSNSFAVYTPDGGTSNANIYEVSSTSFLVALKPEHFFYLVGIVEVQILQGCIEVLGFSLDDVNKVYTVFSPYGMANVLIKAKQNDEIIWAKYDDLLTVGLQRGLINKVLSENRNNIMFLLKRNSNLVSSLVWPSFFGDYLPYYVFPQVDLDKTGPCQTFGNKIDCLFGENAEEYVKEFIEPSRWLNVVSDIYSQESDRRVFLCGGKSVGKSTLLRYLVNKCLKKWSRVLVLDFDIGQCEFTIPGCVSVTMVDEPLLGPNFSHLKQPLRSVFLGEVDVSKCPEQYIEACKFLINFANNEYKDDVWIINNMGFTKGLGESLACGLIQNVRPSMVVQINSVHSRLNFPSVLDPVYVSKQNARYRNSSDDLFYSIHVLQSGPELKPDKSENQKTQNPRRLTPAELRGLVILSYFSYMLDFRVTTLSQVTPIVLKLDDLELKTTEKYNLSKAEIAEAMTGGLVALCSQEQGDAFLNSHGFGIIRGIDVENSLVYLITPLAKETLGKITCLSKGNISLPECLIYEQGHHVTGTIPYLSHTSGGSTALFAKRDYRMAPT